MAMDVATQGVRVPPVGGTGDDRRQPHDEPPVPTGVPQVTPAVMTKAPSLDRKFPCKECGAKLDFDPAQRALKCPYCGFVETIAPAAGGVQELDFQGYLSKQADEGAAIEGRSSEVKCTWCGVVVLLEDKVVTDKCPFCGTHLESAGSQTAARQIQLDVKTQHVGVTFKYILLPIWLAVYRYKDQPYRILVNARSGEVVGSRPYSWGKIAMLVLVLAVVLAIVVAVIMRTTGHRGGAPVRYNYNVERPF